jgi:hypothetical protein
MTNALTPEQVDQLVNAAAQTLTQLARVPFTPPAPLRLVRGSRPSNKNSSMPHSTARHRSRSCFLARRFLFFIIMTYVKSVILCAWLYITGGHNEHKQGSR